MSGQVATQASYTPPSDPQALLAAVEPYYNYSDPSLKPWHLKASYQLFDPEGKPSEQGTLEYWWLSPHVYRSTWTSPRGAHSVWHLSDDSYATVDSGEDLNFIEELLRQDLVSPLRLLASESQSKARLQAKNVKFGSTQYPCIVSTAESALANLPVSMGVLGNTYCFDPQVPALRFSNTFGMITTEFNKVAKTQGRYLPLEVDIVGGREKILVAHVDAVDLLQPSDPALIPPKDAVRAEYVAIEPPEEIVSGRLTKSVHPIYPAEAKERRIQGTVLLSATIEADGTVHNIQAVLSPDKSLTDAAIEAVSHWKYEPSTWNGKPVAAKTLIHVVFQISS